MNRIIFLIAFISFFYTSLQINAQPGQTMSMSLKEAQDYAYENNFDLKNSANDVRIAYKMVKQNTAIGLPQVDGGIDYMDYLALPTSLIPGEFIGEPGTSFPVQFGFRLTIRFRWRNWSNWPDHSAMFGRRRRDGGAQLHQMVQLVE